MAREPYPKPPSPRSRVGAWPEIGPWKRQPLTIPPDSLRAWVTLAAWEFWIGVIVSVALVFGIELILTAPANIVTVFDFTNCYAPAAVQPCERVAYRTGQMSVVLNLWCGVLLMAVGAWLLWELWSAAAPQAHHRRFPEAPRRLVRARLATPAHLAVGTCRLGVRLHARGRNRGPLHRAAGHPCDLDVHREDIDASRRNITALSVRSIEPCNAGEAPAREIDS